MNLYLTGSKDFRFLKCFIIIEIHSYKILISFIGDFQIPFKILGNSIRIFNKIPEKGYKI